MSRIATVIGASGLIGSHLLQLLLKDDYWQQVRIIVRRTLNLQHEKLEELVIDFNNEKSFEKAVAGSEVVFCAIGTTQKKVKGDKDAYRKVDYDIAVNAAKAAAKYGVFSFLLVSSVGANADNNNNFYIKLKGVVEETVSKESIPQLHIFRPSLLMGNRAEKRTGENIFQALAPIFSPLLLGKARKYKPIKADDVARAMLAASKLQTKGIFIHEYDGMRKLMG
jgi:uncharacterized protein YbjT (DUF2867 family)